MAIEECLIEYREKKDKSVILSCYRSIASEYLKICFEYDYIPSSEVESVLQSQMKVLETSYTTLIKRRDQILDEMETNRVDDSDILKRVNNQ
jgi:hypothetical protein